ncbi:MAG: glycosyltransferase [Lentisphaerae bacterium]|nr:glycosyltransferase [Lentisphaerota bacterium]
MRTGRNPYKRSTLFSVPNRILVAMVTCLPTREGYFSEGLDVLRLSMMSLEHNTNEPFDLMVFDNASCPEVREYLTARMNSGFIQYLLLSSRNVGKMGALNMICGAAQSEYLAYADSDVYFNPGWLQSELRVIDNFTNVGMVSGLPVPQNFSKFNGSTLQRALTDPEIKVETGELIPKEWMRQYAISLGKSDPDYFVHAGKGGEHVRLTRNGVTAYATSTHFQFLAKVDVLRKVTPLPVTLALGNDVVLDRALDSAGFIRLSVDDYMVHHLGNSLTQEWRSKLGAFSAAPAPVRSTRSSRWPWRILRRSGLSKMLHIAARKLQLLSHALLVATSR